MIKSHPPPKASLVEDTVPGIPLVARIIRNSSSNSIVITILATYDPVDFGPHVVECPTVIVLTVTLMCVGSLHRSVMSDG